MPIDCHPTARNTYEVDNRIAALAVEQWGVASLADLRACGLSDGAISTRVRNGRLHRIHRGVYAVGLPTLPIRGRFLAAVKACGSAAMLSHVSAAMLWGLLPWDEASPPHVTVPDTTPRRVPGVVVHRTLAPDRPIVFDAIPVTSPARALIDVSPALPHDQLRRAVREAMARKRVTPPELTGFEGRRGARKLARILATGYVPTRSELEDAVLDLIQREFVTPDVNVPLANGFTPDFRWPDRRLIVEADSRSWHDNPLRRADDLQRQAVLEADGERVLRVTWAQAVGDPARTLERLRAAGAPASAA